MDKLTIFFSQLLILGVFICVTTAISLRHKRNVIAEYHWPEPDPAINKFPHETTCHYYYLVLSDDDVTVNKCPDGELFDYRDHKCSRKENARCWSRHFGKMKHHLKLKSRGHFRCPHAWGKYPDIKDCAMYFVCLSGKVKHKKCAPFKHFDKVSRKCVASIEGVCADETDIGDPDYKCPRTWGSFIFPEDCSKYYECLEKRPSLRTCPNNTLFHERKEKCLPLNHVHCGSRHDPYRKKEETPTTSNKPENSRVTLSKTIVSVKEKKPESERKIISESKISTPDPNSIIIDRNPSIPDYSPSFENLSTVDKVPPPESNVVNISSKSIVTYKEINPKSENKTTAESKVSTVDPNSIIIETMSAILYNTQSLINQTTEELPSKKPHNLHSLIKKESTNLPVEQSTNKETTNLPEEQSTNKETTNLLAQQMTNKESTDSPVNQSAFNKEAKYLTSKPTISSEESTVSPAKPNVTNLVANDLPANEGLKNFSPKQNVSNETESSVKISTETILVNDTDKVPDVDSGITNEFIEISTSEAKSSSLLGTQKITVDPTQYPNKEIGEVKGDQTTAEPPQATPMDECSPKDPTCINTERGQIIRCPGVDGVYPYPKDERRFFICEKSFIRIRFCPGVTIFNAGEKKCVARLIFG